MKAVCTKRCFLKNEQGKAQLYYVGRTYEFKEAPPERFFRVIKVDKKEDEKLVEKSSDLETVSLEELIDGPYTVKEMKEYAEKAYGVKLKGRSKQDVAESFVDARYRYIEEHELEGVI